MVCKVSDILEEGIKVRNEWKSTDGIIGNCHEICKDLNNRLKKKGCKGAIVVGEIGTNLYWTIKHYWLLVRGNKIVGFNGLVIIDPSIDQFSSENAMDGIVDVDLGVNLPEVGIFTKQDREWNFYNP